MKRISDWIRPWAAAWRARFQRNEARPVHLLPKAAVRLDEAVALIRAGQGAQARPVLAALVRADPHCTAAWFWLADTCHDNPERLRTMRQCIEFNPGDPVALRALTVLQAGPIRAGAPELPRQAIAWPTAAAPRRRGPWAALLLVAGLLLVVASSGLAWSLAQNQTAQAGAPSGIPTPEHVASAMSTGAEQTVVVTTFSQVLVTVSPPAFATSRPAEGVGTSVAATAMPTSTRVSLGAIGAATPRSSPRPSPNIPVWPSSGAATSTPWPTPTRWLATSTPMPTSTATRTPTFTAIPTATPTATHTATATATRTSRPTATHLATPTATATDTPTATGTWDPNRDGHGDRDQHRELRGNRHEHGHGDRYGYEHRDSDAVRHSNPYADPHADQRPGDRYAHGDTDGRWAYSHRHAPVADAERHLKYAYNPSKPTTPYLGARAARGAQGHTVKTRAAERTSQATARVVTKVILSPVVGVIPDDGQLQKSCA